MARARPTASSPKVWACRPPLGIAAVRAGVREAGHAAATSAAGGWVAIQYRRPGKSSASPRPATIPPQAVAPRARAQAAPPKPKRAKDGWATKETGFNKLGTCITKLPPIHASMLPRGIMGVELSVVPVCLVMAVCGTIGGTINIWGRGPVAAGEVIGLCIALGGYLATVWWIAGKTSVYKIEIFISFLVGALPGFLLQVGLQKIMKKRAQAAGQGAFRPGRR